MSRPPAIVFRPTRQTASPCKLKVVSSARHASRNHMKICYFDAFSGISGDMTVGALVDAGADWNALKASLESLHLEAHVSP